MERTLEKWKGDGGEIEKRSREILRKDADLKGQRPGESVTRAAGPSPNSRCGGVVAPVPNLEWTRDDDSLPTDRPASAAQYRSPPRQLRETPGSVYTYGRPH
ncbi:hypothetical protein MTO96_027238 [Rhipicephalus appendiculatus]